MFIHENGNIFTTTAQAIGHGVNLQGLMGAGIAKTVKELYPEVYPPYAEVCKSGELKLGEVQLVETHSGMIIAHMATQKIIGRHAKLAAVESSLTLAIESLLEEGKTTLAVPQIGAGIGGLKWPEVRESSENIANKYEGFLLEIWTFKK